MASDGLRKHSCPCYMLECRIVSSCISGLVSVHEEAFQLLCDLPWHGRAIWRLAGARIAWLNPLLLAMLTVLILGISSARFAIIVCAPPAPWLLKPASFSDVLCGVVDSKVFF